MYDITCRRYSNALTKVCGEDALRLLVELLEQAAAIAAKSDNAIIRLIPCGATNELRTTSTTLYSEQSAVRRTRCG